MIICLVFVINQVEGYDLRPKVTLLSVVGYPLSVVGYPPPGICLHVPLSSILLS